MTERLPNADSSDGHLTRRTILPLGIGTAFSLLGDSTLYTVLPRPQIAHQAGVTLAMVGILLGVNRVVRLIANPLAGVLYDRYPRRKLLLFSLALGVLSTVIYALGSGFGILLSGRLLWGIAWSGIWVGGNTMMLDISSDENRGRLSGQYQMWFFFGVGVSALLGGVFTDIFGYRGGLGISATLMLCALLLWWIGLEETDPHRHPAVGDVLSTPPSPFPWGKAMISSIPLFAARFSFAGVLASTAILWLESFLGDGLTWGSLFVPVATLTGAFVALRMIASFLGAPAAGLISDRIGHRWRLMVVVLALGALGMWLMGGPSLPVGVIAAFIAASAGGAIQSLSPAVAGDESPPDQRARMLSAIYTFGDIGSSLGPPIALALIATMDVGVLYRICAGLFLIAAVVAMLRSVKEKRGLYGALPAARQD